MRDVRRRDPPRAGGTAGAEDQRAAVDRRTAVVAVRAGEGQHARARHDEVARAANRPGIGLGRGIGEGQRGGVGQGNVAGHGAVAGRAVAQLQPAGVDLGQAVVGIRGGEGQRANANFAETAVGGVGAAMQQCLADGDIEAVAVDKSAVLSDVGCSQAAHESGAAAGGAEQAAVEIECARAGGGLAGEVLGDVTSRKRAAVEIQAARGSS